MLYSDAGYTVNEFILVCCLICELKALQYVYKLAVLKRNLHLLS